MNAKFDDAELTNAFVGECRYMLEDIEPIFIELKHCGGADCREHINRIFRAFHSIKGSAGFLNFQNIASVTHLAETLLDRMRNSGEPVRQTELDVLLRVLDAMMSMLDRVESAKNDSGMEGLRREMENILNEAIGGGHGPMENRPVAKPGITIDLPGDKADIAPSYAPGEKPAPEMSDGFFHETSELLDGVEQALLGLSLAPPDEAGRLTAAAFRNIHSIKGACGFMGQSDMESVSHAVEDILDAMRSGGLDTGGQNVEVLLQAVDSLRKGLANLSNTGEAKIPNCALMVEFLYAIGAEKKSGAPARERQEAQGAPGGPPSSPDSSKTARHDIRVDVGKLDALIDLVGELIIAESVVLGNPLITRIEDERLERSIHHLKRISSELQDTAMSVRMIPLASTFKKMIRLVHDISKKCGKKADLALSGEETEVDKNIIEGIGDPLVHIIRNAVDHGLETPEERTAAGKPPTGTVSLEARHEGGEVWICVSDDGRGLDRERILAKAEEKGLVGGDTSAMSDEEVGMLIFEPGFSTADKVTDISRRGVGMDVVKRSVEALNGRMSVKSRRGEGASIILHIPLTMAIIDGMLVRVGRGCLTIPMQSIRELIRPSREILTRSPDGLECVRVREEMLPVIRMHKIHNQKGPENLEGGIIVVAESDSERAALFVDAVVGRQEIVIKALSPYLGSRPGISGCTILGDGQVSLIVDVGGVMRAFSHQVEGREK